MMKSLIGRLLAAGAATLLILPATAKDEDVPAHKLTEWRLGTSLFGDEVDLAKLTGKVVVIENWGVNCPPCIASLPHLAQLDKRNRKKGLVIIGAESQNSKKDAIEKIITKAKVEYPIVSSASGPIKFSGIPKIFVFDRSGNLTYHGNPFDDDFERSVKKALREKADDPEQSSALESAGPLIESRTWTNSEGREIKAAVLSADDNTVTFEMFGGKTVSYPLAKLSDESRKTISEAAAGQ